MQNANNILLTLHVVTHVITPRALLSTVSWKAAHYFMKVDQITHAKDIFIKNFSRWRVATSWIWSNTKYIHSIHRTSKAHSITKHEVDQMTRR